MMYEVIERATNKVVVSYKAENVKFAPTVESLEKMRSHKDHDKMSFILEHENLTYNQSWWEVDKYDLRIS